MYDNSVAKYVLRFNYSVKCKSIYNTRIRYTDKTLYVGYKFLSLFLKIYFVFNGQKYA